MTATAQMGRVHAERRSDVQSLAVVIAHVVLVWTPVFLAAATPISPLILLYWLWFGLLQHGLTNLMHEAAHRLVFERAAWNEVLGFWVLGPFFLADFSLYRSRHWVHHRELGTERDTKSTYLIQLHGWDGVAFLMRALLGIEAVKKFFQPLQQRAEIERAEGRVGPPALLTLIVFHALFGGLVALIAFVTAGSLLEAFFRALVAYGFVYLYGMASLTIIMATARAVAEHQVLEGDSPVGVSALRNLRAGPIGRLLFGCYGFAEHATHHRYPVIPAYNLVRLTEELAESDATFVARDSYWSILRRLTSTRG